MSTNQHVESGSGAAPTPTATFIKILRPIEEWEYSEEPALYRLDPPMRRDDVGMDPAEYAVISYEFSYYPASGTSEMSTVMWSADHEGRMNSWYRLGRCQGREAHWRFLVDLGYNMASAPLVKETDPLLEALLDEEERIINAQPLVNAAVERAIKTLAESIKGRCEAAISAFHKMYEVTDDEYYAAMADGLSFAVKYVESELMWTEHFLTESGEF